MTSECSWDENNLSRIYEWKELCFAHVCNDSSQCSDEAAKSPEVSFFVEVRFDGQRKSRAVEYH